MKRGIFSIALLAGLWTTLAVAQEAPPQWSREAVNYFQRLPVQEGGRIKPLATVARFKLIKYNGMSMFMVDKELRLPTEWLMDCLFFPDRAEAYKMFVVDSAEVMDALGLPHKEKRDRYTYKDIYPARLKLYQLAREYVQKDEAQRTTVETQIVNLADNFHDFEQLTHYLDWAREPFRVKGIAAFGGKETASLSEVIKVMPQLVQAVDPKSATPNADEVEAVNRLFRDVDAITGISTALAIFPPSSDKTEWMTPADLVPLALTDYEANAKQFDMLFTLQHMAQPPVKVEAFTPVAETFFTFGKTLAEARGEYNRIGLEVTYYNLRFFGLAVFYTVVQYLYVIAFVAMALSWLRPKSRLMGWLVGILLAVPTGLLIWGITLRCIIRMRPPVTTLYETILFITAVAVVVALAMELMNRRRIALSMAALMGMLGVFLANKYEIKEAADTMPSMVAVLDTNFWLSTHVTTITIGYAAGLLSGALAHVFVFAKLLGLKRKDPAFFTSLTRMVYGTLCFGLFFSILGTVLGGIWANESWGRFWGWDPKENGALLICLWGLLVLHARLGGYIREYGINLSSIVGGMIVAFSWFGVNLLGVGLHSYGFTSGIFTALVAFYAIETFVLFAGFGAWLWEESTGRSSTTGASETRVKDKLAT